MYASVGDDAEHTAVAGHFVDAHLHARVHSANQHIDFVALHQDVGVFDAFGWVGLVVYLEPFDFTPAKFAAFFVDGHAHTVFNGHAQLSKGAGVGQHQAHTDFIALGAGHLWQQQSGGCGANDGG